MVERGYNRDTQQCHMKVKELRQAYQKTNGCSGSEPYTCLFYDQLPGILGGTLQLPHHCPWTPARGGVSRNREEDFADEEEEEEEDNEQQASGESVLLSSQDLFITLEPVPSQGRIPDPEAREGSSGANVSMLPLSSSSLRLSQIRRRKKRTRNDMFSELMQSSCTDRAQLNAWRRSVAEAKKALSEHKEQRQGEMLRLMWEQMDMMKHLLELQESQLEHRPPTASIV
nr:uncharacterized protein LOC125635911 [Caretta caretta]